MTEDYEQGRRDGLRFALAILAAEEAKWSTLIGKSASRRTNAAREVRQRAFQIAQKRVQTALNRLLPRDSMAAGLEFETALDRVGL